MKVKYRPNLRDIWDMTVLIMIKKIEERKGEKHKKYTKR